MPVEIWPLRRLLDDQWQQLRRKTLTQWSLLLRLPRDPEARAAARRLLWDTVGHWRRVVASLRRRATADPVPDEESFTKTSAGGHSEPGP
jgi:hypothetical protein